MFSNLAGKTFDFDARPDKVLPTIEDPCNRRDDKDDTKGGNTVVCTCIVSDIRGFAMQADGKMNILMLLPVAGSSGGKRKRMVVRMI